MTLRTLPAVVLLLLGTGACADPVAGPGDTPASTTPAETSSTSQAPEPAGEVELVGLFVSEPEVPTGWVLEAPVTEQAPGSMADNAACQPILDQLTGAYTQRKPAAVADRRLTDPAKKSVLYNIKLATFELAIAERVLADLRAAMGACTAFVSSGEEGRVSMEVAQRVPEVDLGDDALAVDVTGMNNGTTYRFKALVVRVGTVVILFSTVGAGTARIDAFPESVARAQIDKVTTAVR